MSQPLRVLLVEDSADDAALMERALRQGGYQPTCERVETAAAMRAALDRAPWDVVLSDHKLPELDSPAALGVLHASGLDLPFLIVSGSIGEELAVGIMRAGAHDYVGKDKLARLAPAVARALGAAAQRRQRRQAEAALEQSERRLREAQALGRMGDWVFDPATSLVSYSDAMAGLLEWEPARGPRPLADVIELLVADAAATLQRLVQRALATGEGWECEVHGHLPSGREAWHFTLGRAVKDAQGQVIELRGITQDITERKRTELRLAAFSELGSQLAATQTAREAAQVIVQTAQELSGWDSCTFGLYDSEREFTENVLLRDTAAGRVQDYVPLIRRGPLTPMERRTLTGGAQLILRTTPAFDPEAIPFGDTSRPSASLMWVPVRDGERPVGILSIQSYRPNAYGPDDLATLQALADYCGGAVERIRGREALRENESRYRQLVDASPLPIMAHQAGRFVFANAATLELFGARTVEDLLGTPVLDRVHPDYREAVQARIQAVESAGLAAPMIEKKLLRLDGTVIDAEATVTPYSHRGEPAVQIVLRDITARKRAEEALVRQRAELEAIYNHAPVMMCVLDAAHRVIFTNLAFQAFSNVPAADQIGRRVGRDLGCVHALDDPQGCGFGSACTGCALRRAILETFQTGVGQQNLEHHTTVLHGAAQQEAVLLCSTALFQAEGGDRLLLCLNDITERQRAELALRTAQAETARLLAEARHSQQALLGLVEDQQATEAELRVSEHRLRAATEAARIGIWEWHLDTGAVTWSPMLEELMGDAPGTFPGSRAAVLARLHPDSRAAYLAAEEQALHGDGLFHAELLFQRSDGSERWGVLHGRLLRDADGNPERLAGVDLDISERKRLERERAFLEAQMRQQQKLDAIGTLASGVAHEINNPINGVMNYAQLIMDQAAGQADIVDHAREIIHETERVATIVRNLLQFARHEKLSHGPVALSAIVEATLSLVRIILKRDQIQLQVELPGELPVVNCCSQQIQQVIMNLLTNARDALNSRFPGYDDRKLIHLTAGVVRCGGRAWLRVTVTDQGTGIPAEIQGQIFDPFFTTKSRTLGTGLGLAISHGIATDHHGKLHFETVPGAGTRFHLDLPVDEEGATPAPSAELANPVAAEEN